MACSNGKLIRYVVGLTQGCEEYTNAWNDAITAYPALGNSYVSPNDNGGNTAVLSNVTKVGGISLGEEGEVEIPDWEKVGLISDGKRKLTSLTLHVIADTILNRTDAGGNYDGASVMAALFAKRNTVRANFYVFITDRSWQVLWYYKFHDLSLKKFGQEDQELGAPKLGLFDIDGSPADVTLYDCNHNPIVQSQVPGATTLLFC